MDEEIYDLAKALAGDEAEEQALRAMCDAAAAELTARLREGISPEELGRQYVTAVGVLALSLYCTVSDPKRLRSYKAGNLSVSYGDGAASAEKLRAMAEELLSGALRDRGFGFVGVDG